MPLLEGETVQLSGGEEYTVENNVIQLVVWAQLRFVESVTRPANFLRIKRPIPCRYLKPTFFLVDNLLHVGRFAFCVCYGGRREIAQEFVHGRNIVSSLVFEL